MYHIKTSQNILHSPEMVGVMSSGLYCQTYSNSAMKPHGAMNELAPFITITILNSYPEVTH